MKLPLRPTIWICTLVLLSAAAVASLTIPRSLSPERLSASLLIRRAMDADLNGRYDDATADYRAAVNARGFSDQAEELQEEVRRSAAFRPQTSQSDYLTAIACSGSLSRWNCPRVRIFVPEDKGFGRPARKEITTAMETWLKDTPRAPKFEFVDTPTQADIVCCPLTKRIAGRWSDLSGFALYLDRSGAETDSLIRPAGKRKIFLPALQPDTSEEERQHVRQVYLHECGHALGLEGHSVYADDILFYQPSRSELSIRDTASMRALYADNAESELRQRLDSLIVKGNPYAITAMGVLNESCDPRRALLLYNQAANLGLPAAQTRLGTLYERGLGVSRKPKIALGCYRQAAKQGYPPAQTLLGRLLLADQNSKARKQEAVIWLQKAADHGYPLAMHYLGEAYELGHGIASDRSVAYHWYKLAAEEGLPESQCALARLLAASAGVLEAPGQAAYWYGEAAAQGSQEAMVELARLRRKPR